MCVAIPLCGGVSLFSSVVSRMLLISEVTPETDSTCPKVASADER